MKEESMTDCEVCGRSHGERRPKCIRCADTPRGRLLPEPLPGRYLVVDPGKRAGWCIVERGLEPLTIRESGEVNTWSHGPEEAILRARLDSCEALVIEASGVGMTPVVAHGLGEASGVWKWLWRTTIPTSFKDGRSVICEVAPATWRSTIIGGGQRDTASWKADAAKHVRAAFGGMEAGPEEADALCLAEHVLYSLDLADAVGVRRLGKLGWAEPRGCWVEGRWRPL